MEDSRSLVIFETKRLLIRPVSWNDEPAIEKIVADPICMSFYHDTPEYRTAGPWIERILKKYEEDGGQGLWAAVLKETDEMIGLAGIVHRADFHGRDEDEVGYLFNRKFWKKGYAREAAKGCIEYAFQKLHKNRIISLIQPAHEASRKVAEANGLKVEKKVLFGGREHLVYALQNQ